MRTRSVGAVAALDRVWGSLGLDRPFLDAAPHAPSELERAMFAVVAYRALSPHTSAGVAEWANDDVAVPGAPHLSVQAAGDALRALRDRTQRARVEAAVRESLARLPGPAAAHVATIRTAGRLFGLAVTESGLPVRLWEWSGATKRTAALDRANRALGEWGVNLATMDDAMVIADRTVGELKFLLAQPMWSPFNERDWETGAHALVCWLALLLVRVAEYRTGQHWAALRTELGRLHRVDLVASGVALTRQTTPSDQVRALLSLVRGTGPAGR